MKVCSCIICCNLMPFLNGLGLLWIKSQLRGEVPRDLLLDQTSQREIPATCTPTLAQSAEDHGCGLAFGGLSGHFWKMALFHSAQPVGCRSGQHGTGKCLGRWITTNDYAPCSNNGLRASPEKSCAYEITSPMKTWKNKNVNKTFQV